MFPFFFQPEKSRPIRPHPFYKNIGHINEGGAIRRRPNNRKGRSETVVIAKSRTHVEIFICQRMYIFIIRTFLCRTMYSTLRFRKV